MLKNLKTLLLILISLDLFSAELNMTGDFQLIFKDNISCPQGISISSFGPREEYNYNVDFFYTKRRDMIENTYKKGTVKGKEQGYYSKTRTQENSIYFEIFNGKQKTFFESFKLLDDNMTLKYIRKNYLASSDIAVSRCEFKRIKI